MEFKKVLKNWFRLFLPLFAVVVLPIFSNSAKATSNYLNFLDNDLIDSRKYNYYLENKEPDSLPVAKLRVVTDGDISDKQSGTTYTEFKFDANGSHDLETITSKLEVRYDFENDGKWDTYFTRRKSQTHRYKTPGKKTVKLQVLDDAGNISEAVMDLNIVNNTAPEAYFTISDYVNTSSYSFKFSTDKSSDAQYRDSSLKYRFDWDGDLVYDTSFSSLSIYRKEFKPGKHTVTLQVIDKEGLTDTFSREIIVLDSLDPVASFEVDPEYGFFSTRFSFDASNSYDNETALRNLKFRWDFDYEGDEDISFDKPYSSSPTTSISFSTPGTHYVMLEVMDTEGNTDREVKTVYVHWASEYFKFLEDMQVVARGELDFDADRYISRERMSRYVVKSLDKIDLIEYKKPSHMDYYDRFSDINEENENWGYIYKISDLGLLTQYGDRNFRPEMNMTRIDTLKMILEAFNRDYVDSYPVLPYKDVQPEYWFYSIVNTGFIDGIITDNDYFRPNDFISEAEFAKMLNLAVERYEKK